MGVDIEVRALRAGDIAAAQRLAADSLDDVDSRLGGSSSPQPRTPERAERGRARIAHLLGTDPGGCWVAVDGDEVVGVSLALRRGRLWFLSLLAVAIPYQARGIGRRLLDAALAYGEGSPAAWILASADPKALRRYRRAGFALLPGYGAYGKVDRGLVPTGLNVRDGDWSRDGDLVDAVATAVRGAPYGPELDLWAAQGNPLFVVDDAAGTGFAVAGAHGPIAVGATTEAAAVRVLWAALAVATDDEIEVNWLTHDQQWAIDVVLDARLPLAAGASSCPRGAVGPLTPWLPSGAYG